MPRDQATIGLQYVTALVILAPSLTQIGFFDREIQDAYSSTRSLEMCSPEVCPHNTLYPGCVHRPHTGVRPSLLSRYLFNRTVGDHTNSNNFPAIVHHVVQYISSHDQAETKEQLVDIKRALILSLCEVAANDAQWHGCKSWTLLRCLGSNSNSEVLNYPLSLLTHRLAAAAYLGRESLVQVLLEDGTTGTMSTTGMTYLGTPIECAAKGGNLKVMRLLLQQTNTNINTGLTFGRPLSDAALAGHTDVVHVLLEPRYGCIQDKEACECAILQAARGGHPHLIELIRRSSKVSLLPSIDNQILRQAALYGHVDVIRMALDSGANINSCDRALHYSIPISEFYDRASRSATPIALAAFRGHKQVVQFLLSQNARHLHHRSIQSALSNAVRKEFNSLAQLILDHENSGFNDEVNSQCTLKSSLVVAAAGGRFNSPIHP